MESDVNTTLSELERKLKELERELETVGRGGELDSEPAQAGWTAPPEPSAGAAAAGPGTAAVRAGAAGRPAASGRDAADRGLHGSAAPGPPPVPAGEPVRVTPPAPHAFVQPAPASPPAPVARRPRRACTSSSTSCSPSATASSRTTDDLVAELSRVLTELGVAAPAPPPPPDPADTPLSGDVVVEAAPFADLATLAGLEQALRASPGVADVHVRTLDQGRAILDVRLAGALALGAALRATWPVPFRVAAVADGHLSITL